MLPLGSLPEVLTAGDYTLFPDIPSLVPTAGLPPHQLYLGPVLWSPSLATPKGWSSLDDSKPHVYVTLGSSGRIDQLQTVVAGLQDLPVTVMLATAGRARLTAPGSNLRVAEYLPGDLAARRSDLVICNGGSTTGYQALAEGTPIIGIPFNLDQYLAMQAIEGYGAGVTLRSGTLSAAQIRSAVALLLSDGRFWQRARQLAGEFSRYSAAGRFAEFVEDCTASSGGPAVELARQSLGPAASA